MKRRLSAPFLSLPSARALTAATLAAAAGLQGCSSISETLAGNKVDYRTAAARAPAVEVPPDLTQLQNDPRYQRASGAAVSATALDAGGRSAATVSNATAAAPQAVAVDAADGLRVMRAGNERWLVSKQTPEQLWPQLRAFWQQSGFKLAIDKPEAGVMETEWNENRAKIPMDGVRRTIGRVFEALYDSGERDRYRTRVERSPQGTEIYISHRGMTETPVDPKMPDSTRWVFRPTDPGLEAEMLAQMLTSLRAGPDGAPQGKAYATNKSAADAQVAAAPSAPARARLLDGRATPTVQVDDELERAWRRVGVALDRGGFTVEDRDRSQGLFQVRYVDPKLAGQEEPGLFARMFGARRTELTGTRFQVKLLSENKTSTLVSVQEEKSSADSAAHARAIADLLVAELR